MCNVNFYYCPDMFEQNKNIKWYVDYEHFDQIIKEARDYGNILVNKKHKTMKDNLLPFDLEEAKKDPSRIRHKDGSKPEEVHIFETGDLAIVWEGIKWATVYNHKNDYQYLRLTPKRMFVNLYEDKTYYLHDTIERAKAATSIMYRKFSGTFELIPVKEDE